MLILNLDAILRPTIHVSNATCAAISAHRNENSTAIVKPCTAFIKLEMFNTFAHMRAANTVLVVYMEVLEGQHDWIMPNDISGESTPDRMRQCYKLQDNKMAREGYGRNW